MENELIRIFENNEFGKLEIVEINGKIYFPAADCAKKLGYENTSDVISRHCRYIVKREVPHPQNLNKVIEKNFIPEGDLYRLITHSKLPAAEKFESWVFDEVLPTIRKTGGYQVSKISKEELYIRTEETKIKKAELLMRLSEYSPSDISKQVLLSHASKELTGEFALPLPLATKEYSATEIGLQLGVSANKIGKLSNKYNMKNDEYGRWAASKSWYSNKEVNTFVYFDTAIDKFKEILAEEKS